MHKEIAQWTEHTDEQGNRFYFNREERQSTWTDPRPAKCQILYLRMKMLRLLQSSAGGTPGFADTKADGLSRFAPLSGSDFDDPAFKRPKVGAGRSSEGGSSRDVSVTRSPRPLPLGSDGGWPGSQGASDTEGMEGVQGRSAPSSPSSPQNSDSDSEKKKKKKKKKKKSKRDQAPPATPPPRPGAAQNLRNSQSEPSVGGKPLPAGVEERGGGGGLGGIQASPSGPNSLVLGGFDHAEGLSTVGRARVKASIRLEPIAPPQALT